MQMHKRVRCYMLCYFAAGTYFSDTVSVKTQCIVAQSYNNSPFQQVFAKQAAAMKCLYTTILRFAKRFALQR